MAIYLHDLNVTGPDKRLDGVTADTFAAGLHASQHNAGGADVMAIDANAVTGSLRTLGTASTAAAAGNDDRFMSAAEQDIRILQSRLTKTSGFLPTTGVAYWVYVGRVPVTKILKQIRSVLTVNAVGAATIELALASGAAPGVGVNQTLVKVWAEGAIDQDLTTGAIKLFRNNAANAVASGVIHAWLGIRTAYATTQPTLAGLTRYYGNGELCSTAAAGALTGAGPWTGTAIAFATPTTIPGPDLWATMD